MRLVKNLTEFRNLVEPITTFEKHIHHIEPDFHSGKFCPDRAEEVLEFCRKNTGYHIATSIDLYTTVNYFFKEAICYYICYGDDDPRILLFSERSVHFHRKDPRLLILAEDKTSTISEQIMKTLGL